MEILGKKRKFKKFTSPIRTALRYDSSPVFFGETLDRTISIYLRYFGLFIIPYELNEDLRFLIFTFCIQRKKEVVDQPSENRYSYSSIDSFYRKKKSSNNLLKTATARTAEGVEAAVVTARHAGPEPGQCRCACVSSTNLLKIGTRKAACCSITENSPFFSVELLKADNLHLRSQKHDQHGRNPYCTRIQRSPAMPVKSQHAAHPVVSSEKKKSVPVRLVALYSWQGQH